MKTRLKSEATHCHQMFIWTFGLQVRQITFALLIPVLAIY